MDVFNWSLGQNKDKCVSNINPEIACLEFVGRNPGNSNFKNYNFEKFVVYNDVRYHCVIIKKVKIINRNYNNGPVYFIFPLSYS